MYPVNIKMDGRACLVIGGGHVAQRKVCMLLEEKAAVTVIRLADGKVQGMDHAKDTAQLKQMLGLN